MESYLKKEGLSPFGNWDLPTNLDVTTFTSLSSQSMRDFDTLVEAINGMKEEGYTLDFNLEFDHIHCKELQQGFPADQFKVVEYFRFEGESNPADSSILFAIETSGGQKGLLLDAYGTYSGEISEEIIQALKIED